MSNTDSKIMKTKIEAQQKKKFAKEAIESAKTGGFREFIEKQGVLSLAVGLLLGTAATSLINSMMNNVVLPPLGFILGSAEGLKGLSVNLGTTPDGKTAVLNYGVFLNDLINFLVIAVVIYWMVKLFTKAMKKQEEKQMNMRYGITMCLVLVLLSATFSGVLAEDFWDNTQVYEAFENAYAYQAMPDSGCRNPRSVTGPIRPDAASAGKLE